MIWKVTTWYEELSPEESKEELYREYMVFKDGVTKCFKKVCHEEGEVDSIE